VRNRMIAAAAEEMNLRGIKFTMHDLANRLGVSKRTLYEYFTSKEAIIEAILVIIIDDIRQQRAAIVANDNLTLQEKLHKIISVRQKAFTPLDHRGCEEIRRYLPTIWEKVEQFMDEEWTTVEDILQVGIRQGCFRAIHVPLITTILKGSIKELVSRDFLVRNNVSLVEMTEYLAEVLLYGIVQTPCNELSEKAT
jgi:AcrR family transcriptional regulator